MPHLPTLLLQIAVILAVARGVRWLFARVGQPQVIGEMAAGILLGPSLLGWVWPSASAALFPPDSLGHLHALSQFGLLLFMFLIGLELDPHTLREHGRVAVATSAASIVCPFVLGVLLALYLHPRLSDGGVAVVHFALFIGTAMSVTAFPVLARILTESGLSKTEVGIVAIVCAAVGDIAAWCLLAAVTLMVRAGAETTPLWLTLAGTAAFFALMLFVVRPALRRLEGLFYGRDGITRGGLALILILAFASAWVTERLGIHAIFGAFVAGAVLPKDHDFVRAVAGRLEDVVVVALLPLYFAFTGLRTSVALVSGAEMWFYCVAIIVVAIVGKFFGATFAARAGGMKWREASALGILLNTRGLVELVILNVGLDIGVLSPRLFAMMVLMALVTTFMTSPLLAWVYPTTGKRSTSAQTGKRS